MANGVGVKSRLQALQIAYVFPSYLSLIIFPHPATSIPTSNFAHVFAIFAVERLYTHGAPFKLFRHREQVEKVNRLKEDTVRAVIKNSSDIVAFKDEVSKQLQYLRDFAEAN